MKRILAVTALLLIALTATAQQPAPPRATFPAGASSCSIQYTDLEGVADNFAAPGDPTTPSPQLVAHLQSVQHVSDPYDTAACDRWVGESFPVCAGCRTCGGKLEIRVKRCSSTLDVNDTYYVGVAPFAGVGMVVYGKVWAANDPSEKTITVDLPADKLNAALCELKSNFLDVQIQDDTIVDYIRLTLYQP